MTRRRITGKQPGKLPLPGPEIAKGLPLRKRQTPAVMPAMLPKLLKRLDQHKRHQGLVDFQQNQRLHEQARNIDNELTRLGTMAGGYQPSMRSGLRDTIEGLVEKRNAVAQKIRDSRK